jgi:hypothetical protein
MSILAKSTADTTDAEKRPTNASDTAAKREARADLESAMM